MSIMSLPSLPAIIERKPSQRAGSRLGSTSIERASFYMMQLYRANLEVRLRCIDETSLQSECQKKIYSMAGDMLKASSEAKSSEIECDEASKAERLIALLFNGPQLRYEIGARLQEVASEQLADADRLRREYETLVIPPPDSGTPPVDDGVLRLFLLRLLELLHRNAKTRELGRPIRKQATRNILIFVMIAFFMVVAPYIYLIYDFDPGKSDFDKISNKWSLFALYTTLVAGLLRAFFSRLIALQRQWSAMGLQEAFLHREISYTLLRAGVGMCGALLVYFFLQAGLVGGTLFPDFDKLAIKFVTVPPHVAGAVNEVHNVQMALAIPSGDLALLTIWSFLAGFSERLVPSILANTEQQLSSAAAAGQKA